MFVLLLEPLFSGQNLNSYSLSQKIFVYTWLGKSRNLQNGAEDGDSLLSIVLLRVKKRLNFLFRIRFKTSATMESHFHSVWVQDIGCFESIDPRTSLLCVGVKSVLVKKMGTFELICSLSKMQYFSSKVSHLRLIILPKS